MADINRRGDMPVSSFVTQRAFEQKSFFVPASVNLPTGGTETRILLLRNPAASGHTLKLISISCLTTNTVSTISILRCYVGPTITATGTGLTIQTAARGSGATTVMQAYSGPTASAVGQKFAGAVVVSGTAGGREVVLEFDGGITLAEGQDILITGTPDGTNRASEIVATWAED